MQDAQKTQGQLIEELAALRRRVAALEQAEAALRDRNARLHAILENAVDGIITMDAQGLITSFNPAAERLFGYRATEVIGQNVSMLMPSPHREAHDAYLARYLATQQAQILGVSREVVGQRQDGTLFPIDLGVSEVRSGEQRLFVGIVRALRPRQQAEAAMQRADRLALVSQFTSGLAHDIGTPLSIIAGNAELLRMDLCKWGLPTQTTEVIIRQAERITKFLEQLFPVGHPYDLSSAPLDVQVPLWQAAQFMQSRLSHEGIALMVEIPDDLPPVLGLAHQLEQVFLNLLVNSWHALPGGGVITIKAAAPDPVYVAVTVQDNGVGMAAHVLARAFEPFYSTKGERGTGLGLAMCRQLMELHGGTIHLESTPGMGTTVTLRLRQAATVHMGEGPYTP